MAAPTDPAPSAPPAPTESEIRRVASLARHHFGHGELKPGQGEALVRVLRGENVLAVLPTGGGKSLIYQLPALLSPGTTVVVSPLIALMKDQVEGLPSSLASVTAAVSSALPAASMRYVLDEISRGTVKLVYAAPERFRNVRFLEALKSAGVARIVVDEAHCVSLWGHNFRPDYLLILDARAYLGDPPVLAVTATAPKRVRADVAARLGITSTVDAPIVRENLRLEAILAKDADEKLGHLATLAREEITRDPDASGIIYASSQAKCETIANALRGQGINADHYHAGAPDRDARQDAFMNGGTRVLAATVAFGMGIDKADVRFIIHHDPAESLESYYQEAGRAGRDGKPARCVVIATKSDAAQLKRRARKDVPGKSMIDGVLARIQAFADDAGWALVAPEALDDAADGELAGRVALGILVESGAIHRHFDVSLLYTIRHGTGPLASVDGVPQTVLELAPLLDTTPDRVDARLLELEASRGIRIDRSERRMLLRVADERSRVDEVIKRYDALATARADEMMAYVTTTRCRRANLARHFEQKAPPTCEGCDNCLGIEHAVDESMTPDDDATARFTLGALVSVRGLGEANLVRVLRADREAPDWTRDNHAWGALALRSPAAIKNAITALEARGFIEREKLDHGGESLRATTDGRAAFKNMRTTPLLSHPVRGAPARTSRPRGTGEVEGPPTLQDDGSLLSALRAWRSAVAREAKVPAYIVASDAVLQGIADIAPLSVRELLTVKGIGPAKAETYGEDIVDIVKAHASRTGS